MHADSYYCMGQGHQVCQDYARAGQFRRGQAAPVPFALLSDGCSSSPNTDLGARLIAWSATRELERPIFDLGGVIERSAAMASSLGAPGTSVDATLLLAYPSGTDKLVVLVSGDGLVAATLRDGSIEWWNIDYQGAPAYGSYKIDSDRNAAYSRAGFGHRAIEHCLDSSVLTTQRTRTMEPWRLLLERDQYTQLHLFSDGASSFRDAASQRVPTYRILRELTETRSSTGHFVVRRCRSFLRRTCSKRGWTHSDDLAVAGLWLGDSS